MTSANGTTLTPTSGGTITDLFGESWMLSGSREFSKEILRPKNSADLLVFDNNVVNEHTLSNIGRFGMVRSAPAPPGMAFGHP